MPDVFAPAKINLTLHVTGRRGDGYHLLDSLVAFADIGDTVSAVASDRLSLQIDGPEAAGLDAGPDNLVLRAAKFLSPEGTADITLTKRIPVASGIGGGSADAAAALRALARLWGLPVPEPSDTAALGADVPVCLSAQPMRMQGAGEVLTPYPGLPRLDCVLANPRVPVPTANVFRALPRADNPPMPDDLPVGLDAEAFCDWLCGMRNDLAGPAMGLCPRIGEVMDALRGIGAGFTGMSGSGATCFALFPPGEAAAAAAEALRRERPGWWVAEGHLSPERPGARLV